MFNSIVCMMPCSGVVHQMGCLGVQVCIEAAVDFPLLGRFCVRQDESIVAVGMVKSVDKHPLVPKFHPQLKEM